jgi:hypothetical protein
MQCIHANKHVRGKEDHNEHQGIANEGSCGFGIRSGGKKMACKLKMWVEFYTIG